VRVAKWQMILVGKVGIFIFALVSVSVQNIKPRAKKIPLVFTLGGKVMKLI